MLQQKLQYGLEQILKAGLFAVLFIPLVVTSFTIFPYVFGKATAFEFIIQVLVAGYILLVFMDGRYLPRFSILLVALSVWVAVLIVSTLASVNPYHSFWSTIERREGLLLFLHLSAFFILLAGLMRKKTDWERLFQVSLLVSLIVTLYILLQLFPFHLPFIASPQSLVQPSGPLGNPVFVGSYLLFHIFIALFLFFDSQEKRRRIIYGFIFTFQLSAVLFLVNSRAASLGILSGLFVCFAFLVFSRCNARTRLWFTVGTIIILIVLGGLFASGTKGELGDDFFLNRFFNLKRNFDAPGATGRERFLGWNAAFEGIKERPFLGWGLENFAAIYDKYFPPEHPYYFIADHASGVDRAHSLYFDWASTTGIFGLLGFLSLIGAAGAVLVRKAWRKEGQYSILFVLLGLLGGYLGEGIFIFGTLNSYIPLFLVLGFIYFLGKGKEETISKRLPAGAKNSVVFGVLAIILAGILAGIIYFVDLKPLRAVVYARHGFSEVSRPDGLDTSLALFNKSLSLNTFINDEIRLNLANMLEPENKEFFGNAFSLAETGLKEGIARNPLEVKFYLNLGRLYNKAFFAFGSEEYLEKAEEIFTHALKLSPTRQELYYEFGATEMFKKDFDGAQGLFRKAVDLDPRFPKAWWFLGVSQIAAGKNDEAKRTIDEALRVSDTYPPIGQSFLLPESGWLLLVNRRIGYSSDALRYFEGLLELYPASERFHAVLAGFYAAEGEFDKAEETAKKALAINPDLEKDVDRFLEHIKRLREAQGGGANK